MTEAVAGHGPAQETCLMCATTRLSPTDLRRPCRPENIRVEGPSTEQASGPSVVGQERALEALRFGTCTGVLLLWAQLTWIV